MAAYCHGIMDALRIVFDHSDLDCQHQISGTCRYFRAMVNFGALVKRPLLRSAAKRGSWRFLMYVAHRFLARDWSDSIDVAFEKGHYALYLRLTDHFGMHTPDRVSHAFRHNFPEELERIQLVPNGYSANWAFIWPSMARFAWVLSPKATDAALDFAAGYHGRGGDGEPFAIGQICAGITPTHTFREGRVARIALVYACEFGNVNAAVSCARMLLHGPFGPSRMGPRTSNYFEHDGYVATQLAAAIRLGHPEVAEAVVEQIDGVVRQSLVEDIFSFACAHARHKAARFAFEHGATELAELAFAQYANKGVINAHKIVGNARVYTSAKCAARPFVPIQRDGCIGFLKCDKPCNHIDPHEHEGCVVTEVWFDGANVHLGDSGGHTAAMRVMLLPTRKEFIMVSFDARRVVLVTAAVKLQTAVNHAAKFGSRLVAIETHMLDILSVN